MVRTDKIDYIVNLCEGQDVLHCGCVQQEGKIETDQWLHKPIDDISEYCLGLDINNTGVNEMDQLGYNVKTGDAQDFNISESFDVIVAGEIIEHLSNPGGLFESASAHLKEGGKLVITTPNPFALIRFFTYISPFHEFKVFEEHVAWFDRITLRQLAERYGFTERSYHYPQADSTGLTQLFHKFGVTKFEDDFIGVYQI